MSNYKSISNNKIEKHNTFDKEIKCDDVEMIYKILLNLENSMRTKMKVGNLIYRFFLIFLTLFIILTNAIT